MFIHLPPPAILGTQSQGTVFFQLVLVFKTKTAQQNSLWTQGPYCVYYWSTLGEEKTHQKCVFYDEYNMIKCPSSTLSLC